MSISSRCWHSPFWHFNQSNVRWKTSGNLLQLFLALIFLTWIFSHLKIPIWWNSFCGQLTVTLDRSWGSTHRSLNNLKYFCHSIFWQFKIDYRLISREIVNSTTLNSWSIHVDWLSESTSYSMSLSFILFYSMCNLISSMHRRHNASYISYVLYRYFDTLVVFTFVQFVRMLEVFAGRLAVNSYINFHRNNTVWRKNHFSGQQSIKLFNRCVFDSPRVNNRTPFWHLNALISRYLCIKWYSDSMLCF